MKTLVVEPLEPLSLAATPITGIEVMSTVSTLSLPLPTTIAGALGALIGIKLSSEDPIKGLVELVEKITSELRCKKPLIVGPLTQFTPGDMWSEPLINISWKLFVSPRCIRVLGKRGDEERCHGTQEACLGYVKVSDMFVDVEACKDGGVAVFKPVVAYGVSLERRATESGVAGEKRAKIGYLYRYPMSVYRLVHGDREVPARPRFLYLLNCDNDVSGYIRFGGEGRVARVYTEQVKYEVRSLLDAGSGLYIALSPVPLIPLSSSQLYIDFQKVLGLEFVDEVIGVPQQKRGALPKVVVEHLGLGFYEVKGVRRPVIQVLSPGTVLKTKVLNKPLDPVLETLYSIGFASLYPLQTQQ